MLFVRLKIINERKNAMKKKAICMLITLAVAISVCCALSLSADAAYDWITSGSLKFILTSDGNSYAVAAANTSITTADIPSTFSGKPVTTISYRAFRYCTELTSVTIQASALVRFTVVPDLQA